MSKACNASLAALIVLAGPSIATAQPRTALDVFGDAHPLVKFIVVLQVVAAIAAIAVGVLKLRSGRLNGGSAFLSGLRLGGPLLGCFGAAYTGLAICIGLSNVPGPVSIRVLAPGFAEVVFQLVLGFLVGSLAVIANWAVESRIDRQVLRG